MEWNLAIDIDDKIVKLNLKNNAMRTIIPLDFKTMASSNAHVPRRNDDGIFSLFFCNSTCKKKFALKILFRGKVPQLLGGGEKGSKICMNI